MDVKKPHLSGAVSALAVRVLSTWSGHYTTLYPIVNYVLLAHNFFMDKDTKEAITHIVESQAAILRALQLIASTEHQYHVDGIKPLVELSVTHLEEVIKVIKND